MNKILELAKKEINLIKSQKSVMLLIIIYPLLIVGSVMLALSGQVVLDEQVDYSGAKTIIAVTYPGDNNNFDYNYFFEKMGGNEKLKLLVVNSKEEMRSSIKQGKGDIGFFVDFNNDKMKVNIYYDNVSPLSSETMLFFTSAKIQQIGEDLTKTELNRIWEELRLVEEKIGTEKIKLESFITTFGESKTKLEKLKVDLESIDINSIKEDINFFKEVSSNYNSQVDLAKDELGESKIKIDTYITDINNIRKDMKEYHTALSSILLTIKAAKSISVEPATTALGVLEIQVNEQVTKLSDAINKMDSAMVDLNEAKEGIVSAESILLNAEKDLNKSNLTLEEFSTQLERISLTVEDSKDIVNTTLSFQESTINDLKETSVFLNEFTQKIIDIREKSPEALVRPVEIKEENLYDATNMDVMIIVSLVIALLLTSILLTGVTVILEREQGIAFRVNLSKTTKLEWLFGKIIGQLFFVLVITIIILGVAILFAGINISGSIIDIILALILIPLSFVCLSLSIARFANSFSTVVLSSLLIFIPMLLLSGLLFPTKLMPDIVAAFSSALPLTIAKDLLLDIILRGLAFDQIYGGLTILLIYSIVFLGIYFYGKKI